MKIFWSWQSDTENNTGRYLVRDALREAVESLKMDASLDEAHRLSTEEMHVDQGRQGVPGSPDLARTILDKIFEAAVIVADVTVIGKTAPADATLPKLLINPNVAIEIGYALGIHGDGALIMVMNEFYGGRESLPFDLRAKAGPIMFRIAPDANKQEKKKVQALLQGQLKIALKPCLQAWTAALEAKTQPVEPMSTKDWSAEWERIANQIQGGCQFVRADSQLSTNDTTETWRIAGGVESSICTAYLRKAGAMLLKSPAVLAQIPSIVRSEPDNLNRWLLYLKHKGCHSADKYAWEDLLDGRKIYHFLGGIRDLPRDSARICIECAALEI